MLRFDARGIGESEGRLEDDTVSRRITDLGAAIDFILNRPGLGRRIGLVGSSLGGYVSLFRAGTDRRIRALVIWATPAHLDDLGSKEQGEDYPSLQSLFSRTSSGTDSVRYCPGSRTAWSSTETGTSLSPLIRPRRSFMAWRNPRRCMSSRARTTA